MGVQILADVEGGPVDGLGPEPPLLVPELGLLMDGGLDGVRRREVAPDAVVDAEPEHVVGLPDLLLRHQARHCRCSGSLLPLPVSRSLIGFV